MFCVSFSNVGFTEPQVIEAGHKIKVGIVDDAVHGVDTEAQLIELNQLIGIP